MNTNVKAAVAAIVVAGAFALGYWVSYMNYRPTLEIAEVVAKPEVRREDGSVIATRVPEEDPKPKTDVPWRSKVKRVVDVEIKPTQTNCEPVHLEVTTIETPSEGERTIVATDDGEIVAVMDRPALDLKWREPLNAVGVMYDTEKRIALIGQRKFGPVIVHAQVAKEPSYAGQASSVSVGIGFLVPF